MTLFEVRGALARSLRTKSHETRAATFAFCCNFMLMASYYLLRPVRDAMATVFGVNQLSSLFSGTLILTILCSPLFALSTGHFKLSRVIPGVFWFIIICLLCFAFWFIDD